MSSDVAGDERRLRGVDALWGKAGRRGKLQVAAAKLQTSANCEIETLSLACHMLIKTEKPTGLHTHTQSHIQGTHTHRGALLHTVTLSHTQSHSICRSQLWHSLLINRICSADSELHLRHQLKLPLPLPAAPSPFSSSTYHSLAFPPLPALRGRKVAAHLTSLPRPPCSLSLHSSCLFFHFN